MMMWLPVFVVCLLFIFCTYSAFAKDGTLCNVAFTFQNRTKVADDYVIALNSTCTSFSATNAIFLGSITISWGDVQLPTTTPANDTLTVTPLETTGVPTSTSSKAPTTAPPSTHLSTPAATSTSIPSPASTSTVPAATSTVVPTPAATSTSIPSPPSNSTQASRSITLTNATFTKYFTIVGALLQNYNIEIRRTSFERGLALISCPLSQSHFVLADSTVAGGIVLAHSPSTETTTHSIVRNAFVNYNSISTPAVYYDGASTLQDNSSLSLWNNTMHSFGSALTVYLDGTATLDPWPFEGGNTFAGSITIVAPKMSVARATFNRQGGLGVVDVALRSASYISVISSTFSASQLIGTFDNVTGITLSLAIAPDNLTVVLWDAYAQCITFDLGSSASKVSEFSLLLSNARSARFATFSLAAFDTGSIVVDRNSYLNSAAVTLVQPNLAGPSTNVSFISSVAASFTIAGVKIPRLLVSLSAVTLQCANCTVQQLECTEGIGSELYFYDSFLSDASFSSWKGGFHTTGGSVVRFHATASTFTHVSFSFTTLTNGTFTSCGVTNAVVFTSVLLVSSYLVFERSNFLGSVQFVDSPTRGGVLDVSFSNFGEGGMAKALSFIRSPATLGATHKYRNSSFTATGVDTVQQCWINNVCQVISQSPGRALAYDDSPFSSGSLLSLSGNTLQSRDYALTVVIDHGGILDPWPCDGYVNKLSGGVYLIAPEMAVDVATFSHQSDLGQVTCSLGTVLQGIEVKSSDVGDHAYRTQRVDLNVTSYSNLAVYLMYSSLNFRLRLLQPLNASQSAVQVTAQHISSSPTPPDLLLQIYGCDAVDVVVESCSLNSIFMDGVGSSSNILLHATEVKPGSVVLQSFDEISALRVQGGEATDMYVAVGKIDAFSIWDKAKFASLTVASTDLRALTVEGEVKFTSSMLFSSVNLAFSTLRFSALKLDGGMQFFSSPFISTSFITEDCTLSNGAGEAVLFRNSPSSAQSTHAFVRNTLSGHTLLRQDVCVGTGGAIRYIDSVIEDSTITVRECIINAGYAVDVQLGNGGVFSPWLLDANNTITGGIKISAPDLVVDSVEIANVSINFLDINVRSSHASISLFGVTLLESAECIPSAHLSVVISGATSVTFIATDSTLRGPVSLTALDTVDQLNFTMERVESGDTSITVGAARSTRLSVVDCVISGTLAHWADDEVGASHVNILRATGSVRLSNLQNLVLNVPPQSTLDTVEITDVGSMSDVSFSSTSFTAITVTRSSVGHLLMRGCAVGALTFSQSTISSGSFIAEDTSVTQRGVLFNGCQLDNATITWKRCHITVEAPILYAALRFINTNVVGGVQTYDACEIRQPCGGAIEYSNSLFGLGPCYPSAPRR